MNADGNLFSLNRSNQLFVELIGLTSFVSPIVKKSSEQKIKH
jgi:hypothetical protein